MKTPWFINKTACREGTLEDFVDYGEVPNVIHQQLWDDIESPTVKERLETINSLTGIEATAEIVAPPWTTDLCSVFVLRNDGGWAENNILMLHSVLGVARGFAGESHYHWLTDFILLHVQSKLPSVSIGDVEYSECTGPLTYYRYENHPHIRRFTEEAHKWQDLLLETGGNYSSSLGTFTLSPEQLTRFVAEGAPCCYCGKQQPWGITPNPPARKQYWDILNYWSTTSNSGEKGCPKQGGGSCCSLKTWNPATFDGIMVEIIPAIILERMLNV